MADAAPAAAPAPQQTGVSAPGAGGEAEAAAVAAAGGQPEAAGRPEAAAAAAAGAEGEGGGQGGNKRADLAEPVTLGYKTFSTVTDMYQYYNDVLNNTTLHQPLNEYELTMVLDLLRKGHAKAEEKTHGGVKFISVGVHSEWKSRCFMVHHEDGSKIDFSYRKSIEGFAAIPEEFACGNKRKLGSEGERRDNKRHKGGRGRGRGRGRGGRGGRGSKKVVEL